MRKRNKTDRTNGLRCGAALFALQDVAVVIENFRIGGFVHRGVDHPVAGAGVVGVEFVFEGDTLLLDEDGFAHFHGVEEGFWDVVRLLCGGTFAIIAVEVGGPKELDEGCSRHGAVYA